MKKNLETMFGRLRITKAPRELFIWSLVLSEYKINYRVINQIIISAVIYRLNSNMNTLWIQFFFLSLVITNKCLKANIKLNWDPINSEITVSINIIRTIKSITNISLPYCLSFRPYICATFPKLSIVWKSNESYSSALKFFSDVTFLRI